MAFKVAINGFGRIGRLSFRALLKKIEQSGSTGSIEISAINDLSDLDSLAYLLKYDTIHGPFDGTVEIEGSGLVVNGKLIKCFREKDPENIYWEDLNIDIVLESTGKFRKKEDAERHIHSGARKVVLSSTPHGNEKNKIPTVVLGINEDTIKSEHRIISNASCTTNCLAPMIKVLDEKWGIRNGFVNTVHAYTSSQNIVDGPHKNLRRGRAASLNIVPTTTGAAIAIGVIIPHLKGKLDGLALRVPVADGSITDLTCVLKEIPTREKINKAFQQASNKGLKGILKYTEDPVVSSDIIGDPHSCIIDGLSTHVSGNLVKVLGWYDNEAGYAQRIADLIMKLSQMEKQ